MRKFGVVILSLVFLLGLASMAGAYQVYSDPIVPPGNRIIFNIINNGPGTINTVEFELFSPFVIDRPIFNESLPPTGGTADDFYNSVAGEDVEFGVNFTNFTVGKSFSFEWDPDKVADDTYNASINDLADKILVTLFATEGSYEGRMEANVDRLEANFRCFQPAPAPLPGALLLFGSGLLGLAVRRRS